MYCGKCGRQIEDNAKFCIYCGEKTTEASLSDNTYLANLTPDASNSRNRAQDKVKRKTGKIVAGASILLMLLLVGGTIYYLYTEKRASQSERNPKMQATEVYDDSTETVDEQADSETKDRKKEKSENSKGDAGQDVKRLMYQAYYDKLVELQNKHGKCENVIYLLHDDPLERKENKFLKGLCFAKLLDFNKDGFEELVTGYRDLQFSSDKDLEQNYIVEVWTYGSEGVQKVYEGIADGDDYTSFLYIDKLEDGLYALCLRDRYFVEWMGYDKGEFHSIKSFHVLSDGESGIEYEMDGKKVLEEIYEKEAEKWNSALQRMTYGFQGDDEECKASVDSLNNAFETLCVYLEIERMEPAVYHEGIVGTDGSMWSESLFGKWESTENESFAYWAELHLYEDGTAGLHERNVLYQGKYEVNADGSVNLYLEKALFYNNMDGGLYELEADICIQLTKSSENQQMRMREIYDRKENHNIKAEISLIKLSDISDKYTVEEEVEEYKERILNQ